ncbi:hypothetical protein AXG93_1660s1010 [Marchantia polymorpha subsp. ruderalis]|uniref:Transferase n=1 Tax=Marchantia polymorpha subsp. ruderalis TaxID=1480154 RepID=A0A176VSD4_MARPO|nr:hypothetical protein AXG93_1660s1010 [Marchantia polymorpha subsp. ruderalis]
MTLDYSGQLQKQGRRGFIFVLLCAFSAIFVYLRLWVHVRLIRTFAKLSTKIWSLDAYDVSWPWSRRADSSISESSGVDADPEEPLPQVEKFLKRAKVTRTWVYPESPRQTHWLPLSNLDRVVNATFSSLILYFDARTMKEWKATTIANERSGSGSGSGGGGEAKKVAGMLKEANSMKERGGGDVAGILKSSLAKVLNEFYPLAGRLALREDGLGDLLCNNEGALFLEVDVDHELKAFGELRPTPALSGLNSSFTRSLIGGKPPYTPDQLTPMPVCIIQLTRFKCGSIALGVNWHHTVADGFSGCHFVESWAEVARGKPISLKPVHTRSLLTPRTPLDPSLVNQEGYSTKSLPRDLQAPGAGFQPAVTAVKGISGAKVEALKRTVLDEGKAHPQYLMGDGEKPFSSAECLSAFLWRAFARARYRDIGQQSQGRQTRFFMFVDGRSRLRMPQGYFGNVVCSACAVTTEDKLHREPLIYGAQLIRKAVNGVSGEYFRSLIDWVELHGLDGSTKSEHVNSMGHDVAATFWNRFPIYHMDFGWGEPSFAGRNSPPRDLIDAFAMMPSSNRTGKGDMVALLNLHEDRLERIQADRDFSSQFESCEQLNMYRPF